MAEPRIRIWKRNEFLTERKRQLDYVRENGMPGLLAKDAKFTVVDPGNDIICDECNAIIDTDHVNVVTQGRVTVCDKDLVKYTQGKPVKL